MKCNLCNNTGYTRENNIVTECSCRKTIVFRELLVSKGFQMDKLKPWDQIISMYITKLNLCFKKRENVLFYGTGAPNLFYSFAFRYLANYNRFHIIESGQITSDSLEGNLTYKHDKALGVVLGFDLTNKLQEKAMNSFLFNRIGSGTTTIFMFPFKTMRKLQSVYGDVFENLSKEGHLIKVEVKNV